MHNNLIILAGGASSRMKKEAVVKNLSEEEHMYPGWGHSRHCLRDEKITMHGQK